MIANIQKAIWDKEVVTIGGGRFSGEELRLLLRQIKTGAAIERICMELPEGFGVTVSLERNAGTVQLTTATGVEVDCEQADDFCGYLEEALARAKSFLVPAGYTEEELERDNPHNAWLHDGDAPK